jgi:hypothetical protein
VVVVVVEPDAGVVVVVVVELADDACATRAVAVAKLFFPVSPTSMMQSLRRTAPVIPAALQAAVAFFLSAGVSNDVVTKRCGNPLRSKDLVVLPFG